MRYSFPKINRLEEVREAIKDSKEFIVAEREWGFVVNYLVSGPDTFPGVHTAGGSAQMREEETRAKAIRRECRGLIFCKKTGRITRRPLHKFWNINERDETRLDCIDFSIPHRVYTKLDGSMLAPFEVEYGSGIIRWGTKMGAGTDVATATEVFVADNPKYQLFAEWCIKQDITPIFEYTSPGKHRIVVDYDKPMLTLLAARHMITGEYIDVPDMISKFEIPIVQVHNPVSNPSAFIEEIKTLKGSEGVVVAWSDGHRVKVKGEWYVTIHKAKDRILHENGVIEMLLDEKVDDVKPFLPEADRHALECYEREFWHGVQDTAARWQLAYIDAKSLFGADRKAFAMEWAPKFDQYLRAAIFKAWDNPDFDFRAAVVDAVRKNLGTQNKVNDARHLWGGAKWGYRDNGDE